MSRLVKPWLALYSVRVFAKKSIPDSIIRGTFTYNNKRSRLAQEKITKLIFTKPV